MKDGILVVNKPEGLSSAAVVGRLKRLLRVNKIGHTGTLDPFATGVLLIAVGKATRISRFFLSGEKAYLARVCLGIETDTYDCTGNPVHTCDPDRLSKITLADIRQAVAAFQGTQEQTAPAYSALKHQGVPLYKLARQGKIVQKPPRKIEIYRIAADNLGLTSEGFPEFDLDVHCSGGTYIRSLAYDLGRALGCGAHLSGLSRTRSSQFDIENALNLDQIEEMDRAEINAAMVPMSQCLYFLPRAVAGSDMVRKVGFGQKLTREELASCMTEDLGIQTRAFIRVTDEEDRLLAVIEPDKTGANYNYCCVFHH